MKSLKTRKFWFLLLTIGICLSFGSFTVLSPFGTHAKNYVENFSEKGTESDEKSSESHNSFYLLESLLELSLAVDGHISKNLGGNDFMLPMFWTSPNTPPPDLV
jgi:hypothetical protein